MVVFGERPENGDEQGTRILPQFQCRQGKSSTERQCIECWLHQSKRLAVDKPILLSMEPGS